MSRKPGVSFALSAAHARRLRETWRSSGWPIKDNLELDLLAAGLLHRHFDAQGFETLRLTDAGVQALAAKRAQHQQSLAAHEKCVAQVALQQQRAGRVVWRGLSLRAPLTAAVLPLPATDAAADADAKTQWAMAMPDVFSIRYTTVEDYTEPAAFEVKVSRADLLSDLRRPAKAAAYRALSSQCWYVIKRGIAQPSEIPEVFGVLLADDAGLEVARAAATRAFKLPFSVWMALARARAEPPLEGDEQAAF